MVSRISKESKQRKFYLPSDRILVISVADWSCSECLSDRSPSSKVIASGTSCEIV